MCLKKNHDAKSLYARLGFVQVSETETHYLLEYKEWNKNPLY